MRSCWCELAESRPTFSDLVKRIEAVMTRNKPYVELMEMGEDEDGYTIPFENSDVGNQSDASDMV